jgi:hypothetical protein
MAGRAPAPVGILSLGALGVAFHHHLTANDPAGGRTAFLLRKPGERWGADSVLVTETAAGTRTVPLAELLAGTLPEAAARGILPGVILVCTNPDQLFDVVVDFVAVVVAEHRAGRLEAGTAQLPLLVLCANGIYFQRLRSTFIELLEEATLLGRLPDLWPATMPRIVGRLMRGVTIQTALRRGSGGAAVYRPGPSGRTLLTGGDKAARAEAVRLLSGFGGWFEDAGDLPPTRVEFNKAMVNLTSNVVGLLTAVDAEGRFRVMTVAEIGSPLRHAQIRELVEFVMKVGRGVGVYRLDESAEQVFRETLASQVSSAAHVPSSLQWLEQQLAAGTLTAALSPTEKWLLEPLQHYARSLGDTRAIEYFEGLERQVVAAFARAIAGRAAP